MDPVNTHKKVLTENSENTYTTFEEDAGDAGFVIQYTINDYDFVHAIIHQKDILWPLNAVTLGDKVLIRVSVGMHRSATILYKHQQEKVLHEYLRNLGMRCYNMLHDGRRNDKNSELKGNPWLLIQYNTSPIDLKHVIVRYRDIMWQHMDKCGCVYAYLSDGARIVEGNILRKSSNHRTLRKKVYSSIPDTDTVHELPLGSFKKFCELNDTVQRWLSSIEVDSDKVTK